MAASKLTVASVAATLGDGDEAMALRLAFRLVEEADGRSAAGRWALVESEPGPTGDQRHDALLAALAEYVCARDETPAPSWVDEPERFLETWWFLSGIRALHAEAIAHSPISFARRGIFITRGALTYA